MLLTETYLAFNGTEFPLGTSVQEILRGRTIGRAKLARADGMRQTGGYRNGIDVALTVPICKGPLDETAFRSRRDTLRAMLAVGPARFHCGYSDRFYRCCEPEGEAEAVVAESLLGRFHAIRQRIIGPDPFEYSTAENTTTWTPTSGGTQAVSTSGNAPAAPVISVTVGGSGLETIAFTIGNTTTDEEFTLAGEVTAGDVIVVDSILKTVKIGTTNRIDLFDGLMVTLNPGSNTIETSWSSSSIASISFAVRDRFE